MQARPLPKDRRRAREAVGVESQALDILDERFFGRRLRKGIVGVRIG